LYPDWSGAERVRQRLADLEATPTTKTLKAAKKQR